MLNTREALELYTLLAPHIPDEREDMLSFLNQLVKSSIRAGTGDYTRSLSLMLGISVDEVVELGVHIALEKFTESLTENNIISLIDFWETMKWQII